MDTILESIQEQVDNDGWYTGLLYEILSFRYDPNTYINKGDDEFTRVNNIDNLVITTKGWDVQVQWVVITTNAW